MNTLIPQELVKLKVTVKYIVTKIIFKINYVPLNLKKSIMVSTKTCFQH